MLVRITTQCQMGCSHCFCESVSPEGTHMTEETLHRALKLGQNMGTPVLLLSGGEPTEHPQIELFIEESLRMAPVVFLLSNGMFLGRPELVRFIPSKERLYTQITNIQPYYPKPIPEIPEELEDRATRVREFRGPINACRRTKENGIEATRRLPTCANLRSVMRTMGMSAGRHFILCKSNGEHGNCTPSVDPDGTVRMGEMDWCEPIGTVTSTVRELEQAIIAAQCDRCGLVSNVPDDVRAQW